MRIKAIYENEVLRPLEKVDMEEKQELEIKIANAVRKTSVESTIKYRKIYDLTRFYFPVIFKTRIHAD